MYTQIDTDSMLHMSSKKEYVDKQFAWWIQVYKVGFVAHFECLLDEDYDDDNDSESSIEDAIFEDAYVPLRLLDGVVFKISKIPLILNKDGDYDEEQEDDDNMEEQYTGQPSICIRITPLPLLINNDNNNNNNGGIGTILIEIYFGKQFKYETLLQILLVDN